MHAAPFRRQAQRPAPRMRLTARGRAARQVLGLVLAVALVLLVAWQSVGAGPDASGAQHVVVGDGQTLGHVAVEHLPEVPVEQGVLMLQEANGLGTSEVQAGQELVVPEP
ncbi:LysM peptidoglycan-binding domain-containing protein [Kytococcus sp. Marseille-QA3725]